MTNRSVILAIPIIISLHAIVACQCASPVTSERVILPEEVAHTFFEAIQNPKPDVFSEEFMTAYFTGDFLSEFQTDREHIENLDFDDAALIFREPVMLDEDNAIVRADIWSAVNTYQTSYVVFLKREYTWKVDAFRRLFPPASVVYAYREQLRGKNDLDQSEQWDLQHINRAYETDEERIERFEQDRDQFELAATQFHRQNQLRKLCRQALDLYCINDEVIELAQVGNALPRLGIDKSEFDRYAAVLEQLEVDCIEKDAPTGAVRFVKVEILDYSAAYVYAPDNNVPWDDRSIYIESIENQWYFFRTPLRRASNR